MFNRQRELRNLTAQVADAFLLGLSLWLAHAVRLAMGEWGLSNIPPIQTFESFYPLLLFLFILGPLIMEKCAVYQQALLEGPGVFFARLAKSLFLVLVAMTLLIYFFKMADLARGVVLLFAPIGFGLICVRHFFLQNSLDFFFHGRSGFHAVLLAGEPGEVEKIQNLIESQGDVKMKVAGIIDQLDNLEGKISDWLHQAPISGVIFSAPHAAFEKIQEAVHVCELEGVEAWVITDYLQSHISRPAFQHFKECTALVFASREVPAWQIVAKRVLDVVASLLGLIFLSPVMGMIAWAIRLESPGSALFVQERSGQRGRVFRMYKFRSMISDAAMLQAELAAFNEMEGPVFKIDKDPRVTRLGAFLRRSSLDELPQFWNVLKGDMSLVGPRPLPVHETQRIRDWSHRRRLSVKPGLTCLWQIQGRNQVRRFEDWIRLDLEYVDNWSFWMDLKILVKTAPVVLSGLGAR